MPRSDAGKHTQVKPSAKAQDAASHPARSRTVAPLHHAGNHAMGHLLEPGVIQAKLVVAPAADRHEAEADRAADVVMRAPAGSSPIAPGLSRISAAPLQLKCAHCEEEEVQRKASHSSGAPAVTPAVERSIAAARGGGHPLPSSLRKQFEPRFGADLSAVRLHTDGESAKMADGVGAHAFTTGQDIFFATGRYQPHSVDSRRLVAHEIAHTIQQRGFQSPTIQREESKEAAPQDVALDTLDKIMIESASASALVFGSGVHSLVKAAVTGFVKEVKLEAPIKGPEFKEKVSNKLTAKGVGLFILHYYWGLIKGIFSPITGLIDLAKLAIKLQELQFHVMETAWEHRSELAAEAGQIGGDFRALSDRAIQFISGLKQHPLDTVKALANWFSSLGGKAVDAAESGGRSAGKLLMAQFDKPLDEMGEIAGEIIGTVLVNLALLIFTEGLGNAITQIASKLGEFGSFLGKFGKAAEALGAAALKIGEALEFLGTWVTKAETAIAKAAETVLKPMAPILEQFGKLVGRLRTFLRELLGVSEKAAGGALEQAAGGAARQLEHAPPGVPPKPAPKPALKPAPKPAGEVPPAGPVKPPVAAAPESKLFQGVSEETEALLARRPGLKKILSEHPNAADLFKLCKSECFPSFMTDEEIAERLLRLEKIQAEAQRIGKPLDRAVTKEILHAQKDTAGVDSALSDLEKQVFGPAKPGAPATGGTPEKPAPQPEGPGAPGKEPPSPAAAEQAAWRTRADAIRGKGTSLTQQEAEELQSLRQKLGHDESDLVPNTPDHKAQRWADYKARGGDKKYGEWSNRYDANMRNPAIGLAREAEYRAALGGENRVLDTPFGRRQCDVLRQEPPPPSIFQIKTGKEYLTTTGRLANTTAIQRDTYLAKVAGYKITWVLEDGGSANLVKALKDAGIDVFIGKMIP